MIHTAVATVGFLVLAMIEGFNGFDLAFRTKRTLESAGFDHADGSGLLIQEFGVYSLGLSIVYLLAASDPTRFGGIGLAGIATNLFAGAMHFLRSVGVYFGGARPVLAPVFERKAGFVHTFAVLVLVVSQPIIGSIIWY